VKWLALLLLATSAAAETITVSVRETTVVKFAHATAAYAVDATIADAVARGGEVSVSGKSAGQTQVVVVTGASQLIFDVKVTSPIVAPRQKRGDTEGRAEARYGTAERQTHGVIDVSRAEGTRRTEVHVESVHYGATARYRAETTLPSISYRVFTPGRELTLFDRLTDESPLTISNTTVRGLHFIGERWRVHAGTTAFTSYQSFLLPAHHENLLDAGYSITPRLTASALITSKGNVGSLMYDYRPDEHLFARGELAVSRGLGAAAQFGLDRPRDRVRVDLRYRAPDFVRISPGEPRGFFADSSWSKTFGRGSTLDTSFSSQTHTLAASSNLRLRLSDSLSLLGGANYGSFSGIRSYSVPVGVQLDRNRFGVSALARLTNGAPGFRVSGRTSLGRVYASAYVDYQRQAPTLSLIYREEPGLALALEQLGITATTPSDIARALRDNAALIELGYIDGVTIDLTPERTQAGLELAWLGARTQLRARVVANRYESVARRSDTIIATLSASRRITGTTDLFASYTYWQTDGVRHPQMEIGIRRSFDELPSFARGTISGRVMPAIAPVEIELDGEQRVQAARDGLFSFSHVKSGSHRIVARVTDASETYFTTPSRVEANAGDVITFGLASSPGHLFGRVVSDAGDGIGGIGVALTRGATRLEATSASDGTFALNGAPGEWELTLDAFTLPPGFTLEGSSKSVMLETARPLNVTFTARANRSIHGRAPAGVKSIAIESLGLNVPVGADGAFTIRSLPAGALTLRGGSRTTKVTMPREPATMRVNF
jgi:hypothetical protein